jgi:hypothetical protein
MDPRLIPLNGLIALVRGDGRWPRALGEQGLRVHIFEAPVYTDEGNITADAILYRLDPPLLVLAECKGGRNINAQQARRYMTANPAGVFAAGSLPPGLRNRDDAHIVAMFVGNETHRGDLEASMVQHEIQAPLLTVGSDHVRLTQVEAASGLETFDVPHQAGLPPARFPIDQDSPIEEIHELTAPILVAAQARQEETIDVEAICREILPEWSVLGREAQRGFISRVDDAVRRLVGGELGAQFSYEPGTKASHARVRIVESPAASDPRGTPQSWQAQQRRAAKALGRQRQPQIEGQIELSLEDLAQEGGVGEDEGVPDE